MSLVYQISQRLRKFSQNHCFFGPIIVACHPAPFPPINAARFLARLVFDFHFSMVNPLPVEILFQILAECPMALA